MTVPRVICPLCADSLHPRSGSQLATQMETTVSLPSGWFHLHFRQEPEISREGYWGLPFLGEGWSASPAPACSVSNGVLLSVKDPWLCSFITQSPSCAAFPSCDLRLGSLGPRCYQFRTLAHLPTVAAHPGSSQAAWETSLPRGGSDCSSLFIPQVLSEAF